MKMMLMMMIIIETILIINNDDNENGNGSHDHKIGDGNRTRNNKWEIMEHLKREEKIFIYK